MPDPIHTDTARENLQEEKQVYEGFLISVILKGLISLAEMLAGIAILFIPPAILIASASMVVHFIPGVIGAHIMTEVENYTSGTARFLSLYLFSRGFIKTALIWALLKNKLWAYPWSLVVLGLFVLYQLYQIYATHSFLVVGITLFDLVVMYFIWREYRIVRSRL